MKTARPAKALNTVGLLAIGVFLFQYGVLIAQNAPAQPQGVDKDAVFALVQGDLDDDLLKEQINRRGGAGFKLDGAAIRYFVTTRQATDAQLNKIIKLFETGQAEGRVQADAFKPSLATELKTSTTNTVAFGTNLVAVATNMTFIGNQLSQYGVDTFGTNTRAFGTNTRAFGTNLALAAKDIEAAGKSLTKQTNSVSAGFDLMAGIITLNPFHIESTNGGYRLKNNNTDTYFTIQLNYADRWAWSPDRMTPNGATVYTFGGDLSDQGFWGIASIIASNLDLQARMTYVFGEDATNASTIIGSGDFGFDGSVGLRLAHSASERFAHSLNADLHVSLITERAFSDIHTALTLGPAYIASFVPPWGSTNRARMLMRTGLSYYEVPEFQNNTTQDVIVSRNGPEYEHVWGWGIEVEAAYPLNGGSFLAAGGRAYPMSDPAPWSFWIGYSLSFEKLVDTAVAILPNH